MQWKNEYAIGIERIDEQHKTIFEHLLALENAKLKRDPRDIQRYFFTRLSEYLKFHFEVEETLLDAIRYPDRVRHCERHEHLAACVRDLETKVLGAPTADDLVGFFEEWFIKHVLADDREYAAYLQQITAHG